MGIRRVVTGHNPQGKAVFASDVVVEPITTELAPGAEFYRVWGGDTPGSFRNRVWHEFDVEPDDLSVEEDGLE